MEEKTLGAIFWNRVRKYGPRTALKAKRRDVWTDISWQEFGRQVKLLASGLIDLGLEERECVALLSENRPEWSYADLAILSINAVDAPIYATNLPETVAHIIRDSDSRFAIVSSEEQLKKVEEIRGNLPHLHKVILMDPGKEHAEDWIVPLREVQERGKKRLEDGEFERRLAAVRPDDLATLIYTSGTTGLPKGVMLTHDNFISNIRGVKEVIPVRESDLALSFLPLSHSFERMAGYYTMLYVGGTIAYAESIDKIPENIQEVRPTVMCSVPRLYEKMHARLLHLVESGPATRKRLFYWSLGVGHEVSQRLSARKEILPGLRLKHALADQLVFSKLRARMGGRLRFFVSGGAPLAREIAEFFHAASIPILEGYGLTETAPVISANRPDNFKLGSVGQPLPNVEVKIAPDGEILTRGPNVMRGYYNRPQETREVLSEHGWFATGDIGYLDQDHFLYITDRKKDIIVTAGGKNIAPQNLENLLKLNPFIEQVCVIGDRQKYLTALIAPNFPEVESYAANRGIAWEERARLIEHPEIAKLFQDAVDEVNAQLARYETIKKFTVIPNEFSEDTGELTPTLKVKRRVVGEKYKDLIERMYME
ncbi:MAG: long-chain fatty acid--CoA ligase [bacterium]